MEKLAEYLDECNTLVEYLDEKERELVAIWKKCLTEEGKDVTRKALAIISTIKVDWGGIHERDIAEAILDFIKIAKHRVEQHSPFEEIIGPLERAEELLGEL